MNLTAWCAIANLLLTTFAATAAGADTNSSPSLSSSSPDSLLEVVLRLLGALILIFALFLAAVWFFKKSRFFSIYQGAPAQLKIVETKSLGYRNSLMIVGCGHRRFLLAVSPTGVNVVSELPDADLADESEATLSQIRSADAGDFAKRLSTFEAGKG